MDKRELLVEEYKVTQNVVSHYERLVWYIGSILNASMLGFAGFIIKKNLENLDIAIIVSFIFSFFWFFFNRRYRQIIFWKFERLRAIENELDFRQNLYVFENDEVKKSMRGHHLMTALAFAVPCLLSVYYLLSYLLK